MAHEEEIMLPSQVEEMEKAAEQLHAKMYGNPESKEAAPPQEPAPTATEEPKPEATEPPSAEPIKPLKAKDPEKEADPMYWKRRAELMAGKYDAEVPRYAEENRLLKQKLQELEATAAKPAPESAPAPTEIPQDIVEKYGEEFVKDMAKLMPMARAPQSDSELASLKAEIARLKEAQHETAFESFKKDLSQAASNWEQLNIDPEFNTWLDGFDIPSGRPRRELFNDAVNVNDVTRTSYFFNTFSKQNQSWDEPPQAPPSTVPPAEHFMAPQHSKAQQSPPGKKFWTAPEVAAFYDDVRRGKVSDDVATRIEQDIFAAQREGRFK